ncbi:MAG TPA: zf-HC2 domain-containing protein, partial [Pyrinomonadaceae bacterium]|nr:zf-HC2 domain-containing protein [Pyrinomonadaceae bacterium]
MKCDDCLNLLEVYLDGEAGERNREHVQEHLMKCAGCTSAFEALTAENEMFARYDRELEISPAVWNGIAARITTDASAAPSKFSLSEWFAGLFAMPSFRFAMPAAALALIAIVFGVTYFRTRPQSPPVNEVAVNKPVPVAPSDSTVPLPVTPASDVNDKQPRKTEFVATSGK